MNGRVEVALAEIERRLAMEAESVRMGYGTSDFLTDVLLGDREVLALHSPWCVAGHEPQENCDTACWVCDTCEDSNWPCPDAARVLNRYAPEVTR